MNLSMIPAAVALLVGTVSCGSAATLRQAPAPASTSMPTARIEVDWVEHFDDLPSAKGASDVVVEGTFVNVARQYLHVDADSPMTDFAFKVDKVLAGSGPESDHIVIQQTGGPTANGVAQVEGDPLFTVGAAAILFLHKNPDPNAYSVAGGPTGRFPITNGSVAAFAEDGVPVAAHTSVAEFEAQIESTVAKVPTRRFPTPTTTATKIPAPPLSTGPVEIPRSEKGGVRMR